MKKENLSIALVLIAATLWASVGAFSRTLSSLGFDATQMTVFKALINVILVLILILITGRDKLKIKIKDIGYFAANGLLSVLVYNSAYNASVNMLSLSTAVVLLYTCPAFVLIMSAIVFKEKFTLNKILSVLLCIGGSALVSGIIGNSVLNIPGVLLGLLAGFGYALYSILTGIIVKKYDSLTNVFYTFLFAGVGGLFICDTKGAISIMANNHSAILWMVAASFFTSFLTYVCYTTALKYIKPSKASIIAASEPVIAAIWGFVLYREVITLLGCVGIVMVLVAIIITNLPEKETS